MLKIFSKRADNASSAVVCCDELGGLIMNRKLLIGIAVVAVIAAIAGCPMH
jgi:hypothetical protein